MVRGVIHVVARFAVKPERIDAFLREASRSRVEPVRGGPGRRPA